MADPDASADARLAPRKTRSGVGPDWLVKPAPSPEAADEKDRKGAQAGMTIALVGGGVFWAAVIGAAAWFLRR